MPSVALRRDIQAVVRELRESDQKRLDQIVIINGGLLIACGVVGIVGAVTKSHASGTFDVDHVGDLVPSSFQQGKGTVGVGAERALLRHKAYQTTE